MIISLCINTLETNVVIFLINFCLNTYPINRDAQVDEHNDQIKAYNVEVLFHSFDYGIRHDLF